MHHEINSFCIYRPSVVSHLRLHVLRPFTNFDAKSFSPCRLFFHWCRILFEAIDAYPPESLPPVLPVWRQLLSFASQFQSNPIPKASSCESTQVASTGSSKPPSSSSLASAWAVGKSSMPQSDILKPPVVLGGTINADFYIDEVVARFQSSMQKLRGTVRTAHLDSSDATPPPYTPPSASVKVGVASCSANSVSIGGGPVKVSDRSSHVSQQEDAMEFLTFFLDLLHEETRGCDVEGEEAAVVAARAESEWTTVSPSRAKAVVDDTSREAAAQGNAATVISRIFHGTLR